MSVCCAVLKGSNPTCHRDYRAVVTDVEKSTKAAEGYFLS